MNIENIFLSFTEKQVEQILYCMNEMQDYCSEVEDYWDALNKVKQAQENSQMKWYQKKEKEDE